ncbi:MAG: 50S ribosomal protein L9 [Prosthecobacter sp.]|jgi:large subunit ribosomal protein L9|uniref:50S ribosomal protein L9 n=1 Tax=Prosthecobacter sp. TaxID=1965333 RepID=UPI0019FE5FB1|nr:50S ribosomal protein L9 [Prosthecobacter sp.]MBE2282589.1 50S ribosomal protein L9 [Prosthecobacter sp.]
MATTQVILKEQIKGLGAEADVVKVKRGFARNYLLPQAKAYEATKGNLRHTERLKAIRAEREAKEMAEAEKLGSKIRKVKLKLTLATGQGGKAFGAITTMDIAKALTEQAGVEIDRHQVVLERPIKNTGSFEVDVKLGYDITATVKLTVSAAGEAAPAEGEEAAE